MLNDAIGCLVLKYSSFVGLIIYLFVHIRPHSFVKFKICFTGAGAPKASP